MHPRAPDLHFMPVALAWVLGYIGFLFVCGRFLPGRKRDGVKQRDGTRVHYLLNGFAMFLLQHVVLGVATLGFGFSISGIVTHFTEIFIAANGVAFLWTAALFVKGRRAGVKPAGPGTLPVVKELWFGSQLNPAWWGIDLKVFAYQPSLLGLGLINVAFAYAQYERHGTLTAAMVLYLLFWWAYLFTHYLMEQNVISMWDVIAEKFGFMLVWGDLVLVPFFYSIGGWFLVDAKSPPTPWLVASVLVFSLGLFIFRGSNFEKHRVKENPSALVWGKPAELLGGKLLISGFWGVGRKLNYTGEIMVYTAYAMTAGFVSPFPYLLPFWLLCLLSHRAWRDEQRCEEKYGTLWQEYCRKAKFRMFPFVY